MSSLLLLLTLPASATWSIVAADPASGQVGGAGTSCVGDLDVSVIFAAAPGTGAIHAQARLSVAGRDEGARLLGEGASPQEVIEAITDPAFDPAASGRQYGVVDLRGRSAAWTGSTNGDWAGDQQGTTDGIVYSAQGNILTGEGVVARTAADFEVGGACDLPERLLQALTAGRADGEGDSRCTDRGVPSDSAFVRVESAEGVIIDLSVTGTRDVDPLDALREQFDAWRLDNPCPEVIEPETDDTDVIDEASGCSCDHATGVGALPWLTALALGLVGRRRMGRGQTVLG